MGIVVEAKKRPRPLQARGVRRVEAILDAAAALLGEVGYDALTLTAVAERSGSSFPSLYRFFANKDQVMDALADRIAVRVRGLAATVLDASLATVPISTFVDNLVEQLATVAIEYPGLGEIMGRIEARHQSVDVEVATRLEAIVAARAPQVPRNDRGTIVRMTMGIVRSGVRLIAQASKKRRRAVITELKNALAAYLGARLG